MDKNILGDNSRTRILQDMGFVMESKELKELSFCITLRKKYDKIFNPPPPIFGPFLPKFGEKSPISIFHKNRAPSLFSIYSPLTSFLKIRKN